MSPRLPSPRLTGLPALALSVLFASCAALAVATAPAKQPAVDASPRAAEATRAFWESFHAGRYQDIPALLEQHTGAYLLHPRDATIAHHTGFLHMWRIAESARLGTPPPNVTDAMTLARTYFAQALKLEGGNALVRGFWATTVLAEGAIHQDERQVREGYFALEDAVAAWPELNLFTKAFVLAQTPHDSPQYAEAVDTFWRNVEVCGGRQDRANPDFSAMATAPPGVDPRKAICFNTWKAPANFEGSMLVFGDLLVKQGQVEPARKVYASARASPRYAQWPYRAALEARLAAAEENVAHFRVEPRQQPVLERKFITGSPLSCTVCHQSSGPPALAP